MILLIAFAFLAGVITILSPCILPILPIVLSGSVGSGKRKPLGIVTGFILSFTFFTLFLSTIVSATGISADALRSVSIIIILIFGISLLLPQFQVWMEKLFSKLSNKVALQGVHEGFGGGILVGLSLGLVWTPCVGPIIASVITLAATSDVSLAAFFITLAYALGTALPMFAIMYGGRGLFQKIPWLLPNAEKIQKVFGVLMIVTAIGIFFNVDRKFQSFILDTFPQYGVGLTSIEDNDAVKKQLDTLFEKKPDKNSSGKPMNEVLNNDVLNKEGPLAPEIIPGGKWFNSDPLTIKELKGKVVLVDFWTYSCINCQRTMPYLRDWHAKYKDKGLVILGIHSPEFAFERDEKNVAQAIEDFKLKYPIVQDNDFATWQAYDNRYWPAKYLIDKDGIIRYSHFGEGKYAETEKAIQDLLKETGQQVDARIENAPEKKAGERLTPETYLGSQRMLFLSKIDKAGNGTQNFTLDEQVTTDRFSFGGEWTVADEYSQAGKNAVLNFNFNANKVFLVMRPGSIKPGKVRVTIDGKEVDTTNAGVDVNNGTVTINKDTLYELIDLKGKNGNHLLKLEFQTPGIEAFAFTFG